MPYLRCEPSKILPFITDLKLGRTLIEALTRRRMGDLGETWLTHVFVLQDFMKAHLEWLARQTNSERSGQRAHWAHELVELGASVLQPGRHWDIGLHVM